MSLSGGSAAVNIQEIDLSTRVPGFPGVYGAIILPASKGPIDQPTLITSETQLLRTYTLNEKVEVGASLGYFSAMAFLNKSNKLWVQRVLGDGYLSGGIDVNQLGAGPNVAWTTGESDPTAHTFLTNEVFSLYSSDPGDWSNDVAIMLWVRRNSENLTLNPTNIVNAAATSAVGVLGVGKPFITTPAVAATGVLDSKLTITAVASQGASGNVTINIVDGATAGNETAVQVGNIVTVTIEDTVSTQNQIRTALLTLNTLFATVVAASGGTAWTLGVGTDTVTLTGGTDAVITPSTGEITATALAGSAGNALVIDIVDGAPSAGSETAVKVGNTITVTIKDGASTETQIRTALLTIASTFASVTVAHGTSVWTLGEQTDTTTFLGGTDASSKLTVTQQFVSGEPLRFTLINPVTGDVLPAPLSATGTYYTVQDTATTVKLALTQADALAGRTIVLTTVGQGTMQLVPLKVVGEPGESFLIEVYKRYNLNVPVETFTCSMDESRKDGYGQNMFIEDVLKGSNFIRAMKNVLVTGMPTPQVTAMFLNGGDEGAPVTDGKMMLGADTFQSSDNYPVTCFMDGGWATPAFQKYLDNIAQNRHDCVALLSIPYDKEVSSNYINEIIDYRRNILNLNSSFSALYGPHVKIYAKDTDRSIYVSPDGYAAAAISYTALNFEMWYPPAGFTRGMLNVLDCRRRFSRGEMDYLYENGINPIRFAPGRGILIWGQKTLLAQPSALDRLNVRLLLVVIEPAIAKALESFLFDLNDDATRVLVKSILDDYMNGIKARRGVYDFKVVCSEENNTPNDIDNHIMNVWLFVKPTLSIEYINFVVVVTRTGLSFAVAQELL